jgi:hypothetical protein
MSAHRHRTSALRAVLDAGQPRADLAASRRNAHRKPRTGATQSDVLRRLTLREKEVERMGDRLMSQYGFEVVRFSQARATQQTEGIPDRRYYHRARRLAVWWEAKSETGKQRVAQRKFQLMCEACGEVYLLGTHEVLAAWLRACFIGQSHAHGPDDAKMTLER